MTRSVTILLAALSVILLLAVDRPLRAEGEVIGQLGWSVGVVEYRESDSDPWKPAPANLALKRSYTLRTGKDSRAELQLLKSTQRMAEKSQVSLARLELNESGKLQGVLDLMKGSIYTLWNDLGSKGVRIQSPNAVMAIRGTVLRAETGGDKDLEVWVYEGQVDFNGDRNGIPPTTGEPRVAPAPPGPPGSVSGPTSVPGPRSVSLEEWTRIVAGMGVVVRNGKATLVPLDAAVDRQSEWVRWNEERNRLQPRD